MVNPKYFDMGKNLEKDNMPKLLASSMFSIAGDMAAKSGVSISEAAETMAKFGISARVAGENMRDLIQAAMANKVAEDFDNLMLGTNSELVIEPPQHVNCRWVVNNVPFGTVEPQAQEDYLEYILPDHSDQIYIGLYPFLSDIEKELRIKIRELEREIEEIKGKKLLPAPADDSKRQRRRLDL